MDIVSAFVPLVMQVTDVKRHFLVQQGLMEFNVTMEVLQQVKQENAHVFARKVIMDKTVRNHLTVLLVQIIYLAKMEGLQKGKQVGAYVNAQMGIMETIVSL